MDFSGVMWTPIGLGVESEEYSIVSLNSSIDLSASLLCHTDNISCKGKNLTKGKLS